MLRTLAHIGPLTIYAYGAMLALAFVCGTLLAVKRAARQGIPAEKVVDLVFVILASSLAGARLLFVGLNWEYYRGRLWDILKLWEGGLVFYGGLVAAAAGAYWYLRKNRLPVWTFADIIAPSTALGIALGRLGCFLNGCCYGRVSERFGVCFPYRDNPPAFADQLSAGLLPPGAVCSLPVIPTQLYDALAGLVIMFILLGVERYKKFEGALFWFLIFFYSVSRFVTEIFRSYEANFMVSCLTVSQLISVILFCVSAAMLIRGARHA